MGHIPVKHANAHVQPTMPTNLGRTWLGAGLEGELRVRTIWYLDDHRHGPAHIGRESARATIRGVWTLLGFRKRPT